MWTLKNKINGGEKKKKNLSVVTILGTQIASRADSKLVGSAHLGR